MCAACAIFLSIIRDNWNIFPFYPFSANSARRMDHKRCMTRFTFSPFLPRHHIYKLFIITKFCMQESTIIYCGSVCGMCLCECVWVYVCVCMCVSAYMCVRARACECVSARVCTCSCKLADWTGAAANARVFFSQLARAHAGSMLHSQSTHIQHARRQGSSCTARKLPVLSTVLVQKKWQYYW